MGGGQGRFVFEIRLTKQPQRRGFEAGCGLQSWLTRAQLASLLGDNHRADVRRCTAPVPIHAKNMPRGVLYQARSWYEVEAFLWGPRKSYALTKTQSASNINSKVRVPASVRHCCTYVITSRCLVLNRCRADSCLGADIVNVVATC